MAPARWTNSWVNLQRVLRVGSWSVLSLSEDHQLPHLLDELRRLRMDMGGLSKTRRPGSGKTSSKGFTYYWSGISNGHHVKQVARGISSRLQPSVVKVTSVDECIMRLKLNNSKLFPSESCKIQKTENCGFLVSETSAALLDLI